MKVKRILFIILSLIYYSGLFAQEEVSEQLLIPLSKPGEEGMLVVTHEKGSLTVSSYNSDAVLITANSRVSNDTEDELSDNEGMVKIPSDYLQLQAQEDNNTVTVIIETKGKTYDIDIKVPYHFFLKLETRDNGILTVNNVSGEMEIINRYGNILLNEVSGSAIVNTLDGNIIATFVEVTEDVPMAFTTIDGKIDVTLPPGISASTKIKTEYGNIYTDFDMKFQGKKARVEKPDQNGVYRISIDEWVYGIINNNGPEFLFKTLDGNVYIRKRK